MKRSTLAYFTKYLLDFMFITGIIVCLTVPLIFKQAGKYLPIIKENYIAFCIIFMLAGMFAMSILWNLRKMFKTVISGDPFVTDNVVSLKRMGIYSFVIATLMGIRLFFAITMTAMVLVIVFLIAGLFSLVLAQVFDRAVLYKLENDYTI